MKKSTRKLAFASALLLSLLSAVGLALFVATRAHTRGFPQRLPPSGTDVSLARYVDRYGEPLTFTYQNEWNVHDRLALHEVPERLKRAFIVSEDKRFYEHGGPDWIARSHAAIQNLLAFRAVRGASTITEQTVRMLHPRPRTVWSRWIEGFEAAELESRFSKDEIFEFYLSQVPYARERRGVKQAARLYFDRDLHTLDPKEMLALAVLVRSPSRLDLHRGTENIQAPIERLAETLHEAGKLTDEELERVRDDPLRPLKVMTSGIDVDAALYACRSVRAAKAYVTGRVDRKCRCTRPHPAPLARGQHHLAPQARDRQIVSRRREEDEPAVRQ